MSTALHDPAVRAYLRVLSRSLDGAADKELILDGVRQHIVDAAPGERPAAERIRQVLDELGDPRDIAREATFAAPGRTVAFLRGRGGALLTVVLLTAGNLVLPGVSWLAGLALLWASRGWTTGVKLVATLLPALIVVPLVLVAQLVPPGPGLSAHAALLVGLVCSLVAIAALLLRRFRSAEQPEGLAATHA